MLNDFLKHRFTHINLVLLIFIIGVGVFQFVGFSFNNKKDADSSYVLGQNVAKNALRQGITIDTRAFLSGLKDGLKNHVELDTAEIAAAQSWAQEQAKKKFEELEKTREQLVQKEVNRLDRQKQIAKSFQGQQRPAKLPPRVPQKSSEKK